ncbi:VOC family protein [Tessaracoccus sp.]|uniref:hypothetical protein n=1 Tax=Tessaracoccus sp. TaxID=1971211 RepID=UPI00260538F0|nr:hypothetical protein [Tessaracoccus sp.]
MSVRMDNVGIVVEDLAAAVEFFRELGLELEGQAMVEDEWWARDRLGRAARRNCDDAHP